MPRQHCDFTLSLVIVLLLVLVLLLFPGARTQAWLEKFKKFSTAIFVFLYSYNLIICLGLAQSSCTPQSKGPILASSVGSLVA